MGRRRWRGDEKGCEGEKRAKLHVWRTYSEKKYFTIVVILSFKNYTCMQLIDIYAENSVLLLRCPDFKGWEVLQILSLIFS